MVRLGVEIPSYRPGKATVKAPVRDEEVVTMRQMPVPDSEVMAVSFDGAMVNVRGEGWKEVRIATISAVEAEVSQERDEKKEVRLTRHSYRAGLWEAREFAKQQWSEGCRRGLERARRIVAVADGEVRVEEMRHLGYKSHVSLNAASGLITSVRPTTGSAADNEQFASLLSHDEQVQVGAQIYTGDRAYDESDAHCRLWATGKVSALRLNDYRTHKKDGDRDVWEAVVAAPECQTALAERYKIERKFAGAKRWHGLGRCRYLGLVGYGIQAYLTALVLNLKRIVYLLTGVSFRSRSHRPATG
jgi:IS5 family transposase